LGSRTIGRTERVLGAILVAGALLAAASRAPLAAQSVDQRRAIDAFRDTLETVTDSLVLRAEEGRALLVVRRARPDPFTHLRLAHLALRQGDLGGASHYDDAASEFKWTTQLAPGWPYAWYGLGQAEYALGARAGGGERRPVLARDAWSRASRAFARAASLEPAFAVRLEDLARRALRDRSAAKAGVVLEALRRAAQETRSPKGARIVLALGRVERETGDTGALRTFRTYLATGENSAVAQVELGRERLLRGDLAGESDYLEGAAVDDPVAAAEYRADLLPIASDAELADFDLRRGAAREEMLRRFWTRRDRLELRADGERLAEHLRRLAVARREFLLGSDDGTERFDDRGRIFIRHGEPDDRASFTTPGVEPNESWRYRRGGEDLVLHFVARQSPGDFRLVESVLDVSDLRGAGGERASWAGGGRPEGGVNTAQLLRSRAALAPLYQQQLPAGRPEQTADFLARERALGRRGIRLGARSDSYPRRFQRELDAWGAIVVAGGSAQQPAVQVLFAIPGYAIEPATGAVGVVYPVRVRFVALDTAGNAVASLDTVAAIAPGERIAANRSLVGRVAVPLAPGRLIARAAVQYGEQGGSTFDLDTLDLPAPASRQLALGDLLVGTRRGRLAIPLGQGPPLNYTPAGVVRRGDGMEVAVEVFGLAPGGSATLRLWIAPRDTPAGGPPDPSQWRPFPDGKAETVVRRSRDGEPIVPWRAALSLKGLKPGSWSLALVADDESGRTARQEATLEVLVP
jgi:GWxTD domain-containing protein